MIPIQFQKLIRLKKIIILRFILLIIKGQHSEGSERGTAILINENNNWLLLTEH